jgi:hypothetical protein
MAIEQLAEHCWYVSYPGSDDDGGDTHYADETEARNEAAATRRDDPLLKVDVGPYSAACWVVTCDGDCGAPLNDGEYDWTLHLESRTEAEHTCADYDWTVTAEGLAYCERDKPAAVQAVVTEQIPGQIALVAGDGTDGSA